MTVPGMKFCVFGTGAIGGHLAGRLAKGGAAVSVVARGANLAAIRERGLKVVAPDTELVSHPVATDDPSALGPQDVVIVAVKAPSLASVAGAIGPLLGPETAVVFVMNGIPWWYGQPGTETGSQDKVGMALLDPDGAMAAAVTPERVVGGVVYSACTVTEPGVVHVENARSRLVLGEPDGALSPRIEAIAKPLREAGLTVDLTPRIRDAVWAKLMLNLGAGLHSVLTASAPRDFFQEPACQDATRALLQEAAALAAAVGCPVQPDAESQLRNGLKSAHKASILQDLELGRPMEIDALFTVPQQLARAAGVATPTLDLLAGLTRARARAAGLYTG